MNASHASPVNTIRSVFDEIAVMRFRLSACRFLSGKCQGFFNLLAFPQHK
jgi:hypothetical protein